MIRPLLALVALVICQTTIFGAPPPPPPTNPFLESHNQARAEVGVNPLKWSDKLAKDASLTVRYQRDKMACAFATVKGDKYGVNQLWASGRNWTPAMAVASWVGEKKYYNHTSNACAPNHKCGVYTQVVWNTSIELGCAQGLCVNKDNSQSSLTLCYYSPPGNYVGESPYN